MHSIQQLLLVSDPDQLHQLENDFQHLNLYFFWKDKDGHYMGCNDNMATMLGFDKGRDLLGYTDFDLCWSASAAYFRANDKQVMTSEKPKVTIETGKLIHGKEAPAISYKLPLRLYSEQVAGVICLAIPFNNGASFTTDDLSNALPCQFSVDAIAHKHCLTKRQKECLYYLTKGMTTKEIAHALDLSARTVEHYLETVKAKLNCNSRSQLIAKVLGR